jgi:hypothetical protein
MYKQPYPPRSSNTLEDVWNDERQHNSFFQKFLGLCQVSDVIPVDRL